MKEKQKILLIWDFDGVIADSERLWIDIWYNALIEKRGIRLSADEVQKYLTGLSEKTKQEYLNTYFNAQIDDEFIKEVRAKQLLKIETELKPMEGVAEIFSDFHFNHAVATGTRKAVIDTKLKKVGLWQTYVDEKNCFTSDMVENGKPAPDLFLLAAEKMGYKPEKCLVIEDSINGIKAGLAAGMQVIAFIGAENNNNECYAALCRKEGAFVVVETMSELHQVLKNLIAKS